MEQPTLSFTFLSKLNNNETLTNTCILIQLPFIEPLDVWGCCTCPWDCWTSIFDATLFHISYILSITDELKKCTQRKRKTTNVSHVSFSVCLNCFTRSCTLPRTLFSNLRHEVVQDGKSSTTGSIHAIPVLCTFCTIYFPSLHTSTFVFALVCSPTITEVIFV